MAIFINPDHIGDNLPGTGSVGGSPISYNYKRAVENPPPRIFSVQALPATKIGSAYCYGIRIYPETEIGGDATFSSSSGSSSRSSRSSRSSTASAPLTSEYVVWRRWEDCLHFQAVLEIEYTLMARTKRQRLAAGKGVKKDGVYIHSDQAASFDSLPPGPEAKSIAKDIHDVIPKLSKRGTLFRPSQATIDQRSKEFQAMLGALFSDNVPTLIQELRDSRVIRDFFGYWRLDRDHDRKAMEKLAKSGSGKGKGKEVRSSIASSTFSAYFSPNMPESYSDLPPSPSTYTSNRRRRHTETPLASGSGSSPSPAAQLPVTAPIEGAQFTLSDTGSIAPTSMIFDDDSHLYLGTHSNGLRSAPVGSGTSRPWSVVSELGGVPIMFIPPSTEEESEDILGERNSWADSDTSGSPSQDAMTPTALEPLPEDEELVPEMSRMCIRTKDLPPPVRRARGGSIPDRARNRNCVILGNSPSGPTVVERASSVYSDASSEDLQSDISPHQSLTPNTTSSSSRHSSVALSSFEDTSSWRTSIASDSSMTSCTSMNPTIDSSCTETDITVSEGSPTCPATPLEPNFPENAMLAPRASIATMNSLISNSSFDGIIPKGFGFTLGNGSDDPGLIRSLSAGGHRMQHGIPPPLSIPEEGLWFDHSEELLDASFYDPSLVTPTSPSEESTPESPLDQHSFQHQRQSISPRDYYARQNGGRNPNHHQLAWSPPGSTLSFMSTTTATTVSRRSVFGQETLTIKAMKEDVNVLLRVSYSMEFGEVREKIREKFRMQEGVPLSENFAVAFVPPSTPPHSADGHGSGKNSPRSISTSSIGLLGPGGVQFIQSDYEWVELLEGLTTGKLTLRIFDRD